VRKQSKSLAQGASERFLQETDCGVLIVPAHAVGSRFISAWRDWQRSCEYLWAREIVPWLLPPAPWATQNLNGALVNFKARFLFLIGVLSLPCLLLPGSLRADTLVGTTVTGSIEFDSEGINFYIPGNGFVPAGYQNSAGAQDSNTVTIVGGDEFGFQDGSDTDVTSFSSTGFTFTDTSPVGSGTNIFLTMTDPAFRACPWSPVPFPD
jgi:hypothetical protein